MIIALPRCHFSPFACAAATPRHCYARHAYALSFYVGAMLFCFITLMSAPCHYDMMLFYTLELRRRRHDVLSIYARVRCCRASAMMPSVI